jgi:hypothetical protein
VVWAKASKEKKLVIAKAESKRRNVFIGFGSESEQI